MPIYEYQCGACEARIEKLQKISDAPLTTCPECGADALKRLVSAAGFRIKGGGWYETDFKKDGKRNLAGDDKSSASGSSAGDSSTSGTSSSSSTSESASKPAAKPSAGEAKAGSAAA